MLSKISHYFTLSNCSIYQKQSDGGCLCWGILGVFHQQGLFHWHKHLIWFDHFILVFKINDSKNWKQKCAQCAYTITKLFCPPFSHYRIAKCTTKQHNPDERDSNKVRGVKLHNKNFKMVCSLYNRLIADFWPNTVMKPFFKSMWISHMNHCGAHLQSDTWNIICENINSRQAGKTWVLGSNRKNLFPQNILREFGP